MGDDTVLEDRLGQFDNEPQSVELFVRDTDPANGYDIDNGTGLWIDTGS